MNQMLDRIRKSFSLALSVSVGVFILIMFISSIFIYNYSLRVKQDGENKAVEAFYSLNHEIQNFKNLNVSLLSGFSAFIQLKDTTEDTEIYQQNQIL